MVLKDSPSSREMSQVFYKFISWNVNSIKRVLERKQLVHLVSQENPDFMGLQETKLTSDRIPGAFLLPQYKKIWNCCEQKRGYSGTALFSKEEALSIKRDFKGVYSAHEKSGRLIVAEYHPFYVVNVYVPNSGENLKNLDYRTNIWDRDFRCYINQLQSHKPVVLMGDLNVAHEPIDVYAPDKLANRAGFVLKERENFSLFLKETQMIDTFRYLYPEQKDAYSYWDYKTGGRMLHHGWRIDYCLISSSLLPQLVDSFILDKVEGSDHCPEKRKRTDMNEEGASSSSGGYKKKFAGTYQKAKQRVLNKLGKRTTLTRRPKIDSMSKEFSQVLESRESLEKRLSSFQHKLNSVVAAGRDLRDTYLQLWKGQVGSLVWNNESECYERSKAPSETRLIADLERTVYEQDRLIDDALERFHVKLNEFIENPLVIDLQKEQEVIESVKHAKKLYKECRTTYSDSVIDSHSSSSSARSKETLAKQKYDAQAETFAQEVARFLDLFRKQLSDRMSEFFEAQDKLITAIANAHASSMSMLGCLPLEGKHMKTAQRKQESPMNTYEEESEEEHKSPSGNRTTQGVSSKGVASVETKKEWNWLEEGIQDVNLNKDMIDLQ
eukprot:jgi/Galph1/5691/GphlegSOOS_G4388.1